MRRLIILTAVSFVLAFNPANAQMQTVDDDGNRTFYNDDGMPIKKDKVQVPYKKPPGKSIKLPNGKDAYQDADGTVRWMDDKGNIFDIKQNPKDPKLHSILQQLFNGINALTNEGGDTKIQLPSSGTWTFDPSGHLQNTPFGPYGGPLGPNMQRNIDDDGVITTTFTDPDFGGVTTVIDGRTMRPTTPGGLGMPTTIITDPNGNRVVQTPNGPLIYGPDGKIISKTGYEPQGLGGEGHHHGPDGSEIPNIFFNPPTRTTDNIDHKKGTITTTTEQLDPKTGKYNKTGERISPIPKDMSTPLFMKSGDSDVEQGHPNDEGQPFRKGIGIKAKMEGPFKIKADVKSTANSVTKQMK
jgi:hypothetical protein